jgi:hypothetical protein
MTNYRDVAGNLLLLMQFRGRLEAKEQHVVHNGWFAKIRARDELGLLSGCSGSVDENTVPYFSSYVSGFSIFENVDDQPHLAVVSMTGLPCFAIRSGKADQPWWRDGRFLCAHLRRWRYEK